MEIKVVRLDNRISLFIDGNEISNVKDYQIKSSASGETELIVTFSGMTNLFDLSANLIEQT